jgi:hypothetical protein
MNYKRVAVAVAGGLVGTFAGLRLYDLVRSYSERDAALVGRNAIGNNYHKIHLVNMGEPFQEQPDMLFE